MAVKPRGRPRSSLQDALNSVKVANAAPEHVAAVEAVDRIAEIAAAHEHVETPRRDMRPPMREEDPRARAAKRAAEIRNGGALDEGTDEFFIDPRTVPPGWAYEWKRKTILGQEDPAYEVQLARTGWDTVPGNRHPNMMPTGSHAQITRKGMVLMERPLELVEEARDIEKRKARMHMRVKEQQLASAHDGQFGRDHAQVKPKISRGYEPMPVPSDT